VKCGVVKAQVWVLAVALVALLPTCSSLDGARAQAKAFVLNPHYGDDFQLVSNDAGDYLIEWGRTDRSFALLSGSTRHRIPRKANDTLGGRRRKTAGPSIVPSGPEIAIAPDGTRGVVWAFARDWPHNGATGLRVALRRPNERHWQVQTLVAPGGIQPEGSYELVFGPQNQAIVLWTASQPGLVPGGSHIEAAFRRPGENFGAPSTVYTEPTQSRPDRLQAAFDGAGRPTLVWERGEVLGPCCYGPTAHLSAEDLVTPDAFYADGDDSAHFGPAHDLNTTCSLGRFAEAPSGAAALPMTCGDESGLNINVRVSQRPAGGEFSPPELIPGEGNEELGPDIVVTPTGHMTITWTHRLTFNRNTGAAWEWNLMSQGEIGSAFEPAVVAPKWGGVLPGPGGRTYIEFKAGRSHRVLGLLDGLQPVRSARITPKRANSAAVAVDDLGRGIVLFQKNPRRHVLRAASFTAPL
jgi:hypothetical protein